MLQPNSFKVIIATLTFWNKCIKFMNIYHPNALSITRVLRISLFYGICDLFSAPAEIVITGDFSIHLDNSDSITSTFAELLSNFDLKQRITSPAHDKGHTLDVSITQSDCHLLKVTKTCTGKSYLSDPPTITADLTFPHTLRP